MPNVYFNNYNEISEQSVYEDLLVEAIEIHGVECLYLPRRLQNHDPIYNADDISLFDKAYPLDLYIDNFEGFQGEKDIMSKFNVEIRDQLSFTVANITFKLNVGQHENFVRPREGDLIYFKLNKKCFEIRFVENKPYFYQLGYLPAFKLNCELYEYSMERFNTGVPEIDSIQTNLSINILDYALTDGNGNYLMDGSNNYIVSGKYDLDVIDPLQDNEDLQKEADDIIDFSVQDPFCVGEN